MSGPDPGSPPHSRRRRGTLARVAAGAYRLALTAFPRPFRHRFGPEMLATFRDDASVARGRGALPLALLTVRACLDAIVSGLTERLEASGMKRRRPSGGDKPVPEPPRSPRRMIDTLMQDLRFALRTLSAQPTFTLVVVVTIALGVGAVTAVYGAVEGIVLSPLPYPDDDRLALLWQPGQSDPEGAGAVSPVDLEDFKRGNESFEWLGGLRSWRPTLTGVEVPESLAGILMAPEALRALRVRPALGRLFEPDEVGPEARVALLSDGLWRRKFDADPDIIGRSVRLDDSDFRVVGVMPPDFVAPMSQPTEVIASLDVDPAEYSRGSRFLMALGRLQPGVSLEEAQADMSRIAATIAADHPDSNETILARVVPLREEIVGGAARPLYLLLGAVGFVLLITVANVANLMVARGVTRSHELAVRSALGAGSGRLASQLLTESLLLAGLGGATGVLLAQLAIEGLVAAAPAGLPRLETVRIDSGVLVFAVGVALLAGMTFGIVSALRARRPQALESLRSARGGADRGGHTLRRVLVAVQIAVALVLLIGSGLLLNSLVHLLSEDPGFDAEGVVATRVRLGNRYADTARQVRFFSSLLDRLDAHPAVDEAGASFLAPFSGANVGGSFSRVDEPEPADGDDPSASVHFVSHDFFELLDVPVLAGRDFDPGDDADAEPVAVISESAARRFWPDDNPVGQRLRLHVSLDDQSPDVPRRIVGVVGDVKHRRLDAEPTPMVYAPAPQRPTRSLFVLLRLQEGAASPGPVLRSILGELDPDVPILEVETLAEMIGSTVSRDRFAALLLTAFALAAVVLGCVGIYGVVAYAVTARTGEFGVRIAMGASGGDIHRLVLRDTALVAGAGVAVGLLGSALLSRFLEGMLHEVGTTDPATFGLMTALLLAAAFVATLGPTRRAARVDPVEALRAD